MRKNYYTFLLALFMATTMVAPPPDNQFVEAKIGNKKYILEVADTVSKRAEGLSNRKSLAQDKGMLFIFEQSANYKFCMAEMNFPLDFIWLQDTKVVALTKNVPPLASGEKIRGFTVKHKFNKVIEFNAGQIKNSGVAIGDLIRITIPEP